MNNNSKLTKRVQESAGLSKLDAEKAIQATLLSIKELAIEDGKLTIQGYGTFSNVAKPAREGRNPKTGQPVTIPAREVFSFKGAK